MALAAATISSAHAGDAIYNANNQLSVSLGSHNLHYREFDTFGLTGTNVLDSEKGAQPAVLLSATGQGEFLGFNDIYTNATLGYSHGNTKYDGYLQSMDGSQPLVPYKTTTKNTTLDLGLKVGKVFNLTAARSAALTPYVAYGYHNWNRDMSGDPYGYKETYQHHTLGVGLLGQVAATDNLVLSADYSIGRTLGADMKLADARFKLGSNTSHQFALGADYALTKKLHLNAQYRLSVFKYSESPVVGGMLEPSSKTIENSFLVGVGYRM